MIPSLLGEMQAAIDRPYNKKQSKQDNQRNSANDEAKTNSFKSKREMPINESDDGDSRSCDYYDFDETWDEQFARNNMDTGVTR